MEGFRLSIPVTLPATAVVDQEGRIRWHVSDSGVEKLESCSAFCDSGVQEVDNYGLFQRFCCPGARNLWRMELDGRQASWLDGRRFDGFSGGFRGLVMDGRATLQWAHWRTLVLPLLEPTSPTTIWGITMQIKTMMFAWMWIAVEAVDAVMPTPMWMTSVC